MGLEEDIKPRHIPILGEKSHLAILLTTSCNLRCKYCFARRGEKQETIDFDFVKSGIYHFFKSTDSKTGFLARSKSVAHQRA